MFQRTFLGPNGPMDSFSSSASPQRPRAPHRPRFRLRGETVAAGLLGFDVVAFEPNVDEHARYKRRDGAAASLDGELEAVGGVDPARVAVVKLDIQGHEYEALAGAAKLCGSATRCSTSVHTGSTRREDANRAFCLAKYVGGYDCVKPPPAAAVQNAGEMAYCVPEGWRAAFPTHDAPCGGGAVRGWGARVTKICEDGPAPPVPAPARAAAPPASADVARLRGHLAPPGAARAARPRSAADARGASGRALCAAPRAAAARGGAPPPRTALEDGRAARSSTSAGATGRRRAGA
ncbi:hypothetical protein JL722_13440 [Aureococcus anophagefferens]|nr:hypothetical protein JL722_13440 [Aureococcus anophagefferens]